MLAATLVKGAPQPIQMLSEIKETAVQMSLGQLHNFAL